MITPESRGEEIKKYAWNHNNATDIDFKLVHYYDANCNLLNYLLPAVISMAVFMFAVSIVWFIYAYKLWDQ